MQRRKPASGKPRPKNIFDRFDEEKKGKRTEGSRERTDKKPAERKSGKSDEREKRSRGDKPSYSKRSSGRDRDDKKSYERKSGSSEGRESRSYSDKPSYSKRSSGRDRDEKPSYSKRSSDRNRDDEKSYERKSRSSEGRESRSYSDKPSYSKRSSDRNRDDEKSYERKSRSSEGRESRSYGDKPSYSKRFSDRNRDDEKSYERKSRSSEGRESRSYGDKPSYSKRSSDRNRDDEKSYERKSRSSEGRESRSYGDKPSYSKRTSDRDRDDKPKKYGERDSFNHKSKRDDDRESSTEKRSYTKSRNNDDREFKSYRDRTEPRKNSHDEDSDDNYGDKHKLKRKDDEKYSDKPYVSKHRDDDAEHLQKYSDKNAKKTDHKEKRTHADEGKIRLNKYIANAGICSRREADKLIESGAVTVNGVIVTELGHKITSSDIVSYGGTPIKREKSVYVLLNKPKDYITTLDDPEGRKTVLDLVKNAGRERIYPVGRLDRNTTGLLLLTNDGEMTAKLTHPKYGVRKVYHVTLDKNLRREDMNAIAEGLELEDGMIKVDAIEYAGDGVDKKDIGIEIHSGKNRIVRRIFEHLGYEVLRLDRVIFAGLSKKDLPRGRWRFLTAKEVNFLKMA